MVTCGEIYERAVLNLTGCRVYPGPIHGSSGLSITLLLTSSVSLCNDLKHSLKEAVQNLLSWTLNNADQGVDGLMDELNGVFI